VSSYLLYMFWRVVRALASPRVRKEGGTRPVLGRSEGLIAPATSPLAKLLFSAKLSAWIWWPLDFMHAFAVFWASSRLN